MHENFHSITAIPLEGKNNILSIFVQFIKLHVGASVRLELHVQFLKSF